MAVDRGMAKRWCFTSFEDTIKFNEEKIVYFIFGRESCPTTGKKHLQGYVVFKTQQRLSAVKKIDGRAHWEKARGSVADNIKYCSKDGDVTSFGDPPEEQSFRGGEARKAQYDDARKYAQLGDFDSIESSILLHCYNNIKRIRSDYMLLQPVANLVEGAVPGLWLSGPPGIGKSHYARELGTIFGLGVYPKRLNKWWDGYNGEDLVVIDDFDPFFADSMGHSLKLWIDRYSLFVEIKSGTLKIRPRGIIVTSNYSMQTLFGKDESLLSALARRFVAPNIGIREDLSTGYTWYPPEHEPLPDVIAPVITAEPEQDVNIIDFNEDMFE